MSNGFNQPLQHKQADQPNAIKQCCTQARLDSLVERTEAIGSKTIEKFQGRDDHLVYRSTRYGCLEPQHSDLR